MTYIPITDAEIADEKPLKSDILARLRDNPLEKLCDPPGSTTLKLRPSIFDVVRHWYQVYSATPTICISFTDQPGEVSNVTVKTCPHSDPSCPPSYMFYGAYGATAILTFSFLPKYSAGSPSAVRVARMNVPVMLSGVGSGTLYDQAWVDIPVTGTWVSIFTITKSGQTPTLQVRAFVVGNELRVEAQWIHTFTGIIYTAWTGFVATLTFKNA